MNLGEPNLDETKLGEPHLGQLFFSFFYSFGSTKFWFTGFFYDKKICLYECIGEPKLVEPDLVEPKLGDLDETKKFT